MTDELITLVLQGAPRQLRFQTLPGKESRHTGRELLSREINFVAPSRQTKDITKELSAARAPEGAIEEVGTARRWIVQNSSYSYRDDGPNVNHTISIAELEELNASQISFLGLTVHPDRYQEHASDNQPLMISFIATVPKAEVDKFEKTLGEHRKSEQGPSYFDVTRTGVSDKNIAMRFGKCVWQQLSPNGRRHMITLVSKEGDSERTYSGFRVHEPGISRISDLVLDHEEKLNALITKLQEKGILSEEDSQEIHKSHTIASPTQYRILERTTDLDSFWFD